MEGDAFSQKQQCVEGVPFWVLTLPRNRVRRSIALQRGIRGLQKRGVYRCVFPEGFSQRTWFSDRGVEGVDVRSLLRKKAGEWALEERRARRLTGSVAVQTERLTGDVERAVRRLLGEVLCVSLVKVRGAEELQGSLRRESGAVLRLLAASELPAAETLLDFSDSAWEGRLLTLRLEKTELPHFLLPSPWRGAFPPGIDSGELAAALWSLGKVKTERIGLKSRM